MIQICIIGYDTPLPSHVLTLMQSEKRTPPLRVIGVPLDNLPWPHLELGCRFPTQMFDSVTIQGIVKVVAGLSFTNLISDSGFLRIIFSGC